MSERAFGGTHVILSERLAASMSERALGGTHVILSEREARVEGSRDEPQLNTGFFDSARPVGSLRTE